ncbi:MAG: hypothetical protein SNI70_10765 [Rikenellaceae bacterium]
MDIEKAKEINAKVLAYAFWGSGLSESRPAENITESLSELVEACHMVAAYAKTLKTGSIPMSIDDRGIAAVYTATHFTPDMEIIARGNGGSLLLIPDQNINQEE